MRVALRCVSCRRSVLVSMVLRRFIGVLLRMQVVCMCHMGVMRGLLMLTRLVVLGGFVMVISGVGVMLGRVLVVLCCFVV